MKTNYKYIETTHPAIPRSKRRIESGETAYTSFGISGGSLSTGQTGINTDVEIKEGEGILVDKNTDGQLTYTIAHGHTSEASSTQNDKTFVVKNIEVDQFGHVTGFENGNVTEELDGRYLRKDKADTTDYRVDFHNGATFGEYVEGFLGDGAIIDKDGYAEMNGLKLREFLEVPELRFNRIDVVSGELWNAIAFGLIESVDTERQIVTLKLEEGERSGLHLNDFCRGIFHNMTGNAENAGKDDAGFDVMVGFSTSYFTPVEILDEKSFRYELKPGSTTHPCTAMKFAVYGNAVEENRQKSAYHTRTYTRYLYNVNTWKIQSHNIAMQLGDLSGLTVNGMNMGGYSCYMNNLYFSGHIEYAPETKKELKGDDAYAVTLSTYSSLFNANDEVAMTAEVLSGNNKIITQNQQVVATNFLASTTIQAYKGALRLRASDIIGEGKYIASFEATGCSCVLTDGMLVVTSIETDKADVKITVNCEGIALYELDYTVVRVTDGRDGKDYEYIFKLTVNETVPGVPAITEEGYQNDDYTGSWNDDPVDPTAALPFEWVSQRIKRNGLWGAFSVPSVWARYTEDGASVEVQWSSDGINWHNNYTTSDIYMRQRTGKNSWGNAMRVVGENGQNGEDGAGVSFVFMAAETQPAIPSPGPIIPPGWSDGPPVQGVLHGSNWNMRSDGYLQSGAISHSQKTMNRVQFTTKGAGNITIHLKSSSEANYDYAFVGKVNDSNPTSSNCLDKISGNNASKNVTVTVSEAGTYFVMIGYQKDGSQSQYDDCGMYKVISASNISGNILPLWMSKSAIVNGVSTDWSIPIRLTGTDGKDAEPLGPPEQKKWEGGKTYYRNAEKVDYIYYEVNDSLTWWRVRKGLSQAVAGSAPPSPEDTNSNFEQINSFQAIATHTMLANDANLAGFTFHNKKLFSDDKDSEGNSMLTIDGYSGEIVARKGIFMGSIGTPFVEVDFSENAVITLEDNFNISTKADESNITIQLPVDEKYNGVRCNILNWGMTKNSFYVNVKSQNGKVIYGNKFGQYLSVVPIRQGAIAEFICVKLLGEITWFCMNFDDIEGI